MDPIGSLRVFLLLAGSNSLPTLFANPATGTVNEMFENGLIADTEAVFGELGIFDQLKPVAVGLLKKLGKGTLPNIPTELNVEGFWYNKQIFADNGIEMVQLYVKHLGSAVERPPQELKAFERIRLAPRQTKTVALELDAAALAYWDNQARRFVVEAGPIQVRVGRSSADIQLEARADLRA